MAAVNLVGYSQPTGLDEAVTSIGAQDTRSKSRTSRNLLRQARLGSISSAASRHEAADEAAQSIEELKTLAQNQTSNLLNKLAAVNLAVMLRAPCHVGSGLQDWKALSYT